MAGGIGLAAGANINPEKTYPSMFEPIHGSAPDIAGKGLGNPLAAIWSASQLLDFLGYEEYGKLVLEAIGEPLVEGNVLTPDMKGTSFTFEVGNRVIEIIQSFASIKA
jgi:tartrate dehydrogenase/decarboxylase/D-malate dehydrogenase